MKHFYSILDTGCSRLVTQPIQHLVNADMAQRAGGKVVFYTAEDVDTLKEHTILRSKLHEKPPVDGFVFFRILQFGYGGQLDFRLIASILAAGYEMHFARERFSIPSLAALDQAFPELKCYEHFNCGKPFDTY
ncbi:MAG: hypothetical protein OHK0024_04630 [Thalassobaculales bacterium]